MATGRRRDRGVGWTRRGFLGAGAAAAGGAALSALWPGRLLAGAAAAGTRPPNILFILADDYGLDGVGCYGADGRSTPNLDALARGGVRFETCYSAPLCGPTRCEFLTGRYPFRTGGLSNQSAGRPSPADELSVAALLKRAGYATGMAGKWRQVGGTPAQWGFDEYITDPTASGWHWVKSYTKNGKEVRSDSEVYYPDVTHDFAADFMARHRDAPFFFYAAMHLVHAPIVRTPDSRNGSDLYADNIAYLDKLVGKLVAELDRLGLRENTVVLFSSDNGSTIKGSAGRAGTIGGRRINGQKGSMLEGGARVPLIASWPGTAPAGIVRPDLVDFSDLLPTFLDLAGAKPPEGLVLDGRSFAPALRGQPGAPREWVFVQLARQWYVRDRKWKLTGDGALFDMSDAPFEEKPVAADAADPDAADGRRRLRAVLDALNPAAGKTEPPAEKRPGQKGGGGRRDGRQRRQKPADAAPAGQRT